MFQLPIDIDVIKHPQELDSKSTAVHAAVLAPKQLHIYTYPEVPDYRQQGQKVSPCMVTVTRPSLTASANVIA